jgi:hypothetical protein
MKNPIKRSTFLLALAVLLLAGGIVLAQTGGGYDLTWWTVDGGGDTVGGGGYILVGTVGQPEPGSSLTGGSYTLYSGFWPGGGAAAPTCPVPLTGVSVSGPSSGKTEQTLTFNANPQPGNATAPVAYTWSSDGLVSGQGTSQASYRWTSTGSKTVQVTAQNCGGTPYSDSKSVSISLACPRPIVDVSITGLDTGYTDVDYSFTASPDPSDATEPITYTWSNDGLISGQSTADATYSWTITGTHALSVTVENCGGSASDTHTITIGEQSSSCDYPITGVTIGGPTTGGKGTDYVFTATVQPSNATEPVAYTWSSNGLVSGQGSANATYRWSQSGEYQITVSVGNCGGSKNNSHTIEIGIEHVYLPLVARNF